MYIFLKRKLGKTVADTMMVIWYLSLLFSIAIFFRLESGMFRYLEW
ncbi:hypothetical protein BC781_11080 [Sediminitomix flava]|uniref:Uncharacterized protein n=1 Tax=Sediminitomix flava TaxID=379075 RepID=A0A315YYS6_SEDFL|nr:hypothetical protein BC781_11080 [Sediminitomix flava]